MPSSELSEIDVAERLGKSRRWVQCWISEDSRKPNPVGQFHHYVGASKRWSEEAFQALRTAIIQDCTAAKGADSKSTSKAAHGMSPEPLRLTDGRSELENLLTFPTRARNTKPRQRGQNLKRSLSKKRSTGSNQVVPLQR